MRFADMEFRVIYCFSCVYGSAISTCWSCTGWSAHPCVVPLCVQQGDGEGGSKVGRVENVSETEPTFTQKPDQTSEDKHLHGLFFLNNPTQNPDCTQWYGFTPICKQYIHPNLYHTLLAEYATYFYSSKNRNTS